MLIETEEDLQNLREELQRVVKATLKPYHPQEHADTEFDSAASEW